MEVGNVNSKHLVLALKVKSILDPCEDENDDLAEDDEVSLGVDSFQQDDSSSTDSEVHHSPENQYIVAPIGNRREDNDMVHEDDDTQDPERDERKLARVRDWIASRHTDTIDLADVLLEFPDISVELTEDIIDKLTKEGILSRTERDAYTITKPRNNFKTATVKEEIDAQGILPVAKASNNMNDNYMYMKALYYALPMDYVTVAKLHSKLDGEANQTTVRKLIDKMAQDGFLEGVSNRRMGKRVIHSKYSDRKLMEVKNVLVNKASGMVISSEGLHSKANSLSFPPVDNKHKDTSTCGGIHSIGSDLTRTEERSKIYQNGSILSRQTTCTKTGEKGNNTPMSKPQPAASTESGVPRNDNEGATGRDPCFVDPDATLCSRSTQEKRTRKASTVKEPILQSFKRQKSHAP